MSLFDHASPSAQYISASKLRHFYLRANYFQFFRLDDGVDGFAVIVC